MIIDRETFDVNMTAEEPDTDILAKLIKRHESEKKSLGHLMDYYWGRHNIRNRVRDSKLPNNKVTANFAKYITDMAVGYFLGSPVSYTANRDIDKITDCFYSQGISRIDTEIAKMCSIYGMGYELIYADENADICSAALSPMNTFVVYDNSVKHNKLCAVNYYIDTDIDGQNRHYVVCLYTDKYIFTFESQGTTTANMRLTGISEHFFGDVPVIEYINNSERQGDFEQVISLIDAYNILQSDRINDKEQFVNAFLVLIGIEIDSEQAQKLKEEKILCAPETGGDAKYLCKNLTESDTEVLRDCLVDDIHKFSLVPDMTDDKFGGNLSGVAIRYKLLAFEQMVKNKEQYFSVGLRERFKIYNRFLNVKAAVPIIPQTEIEPVFKRNLPVNEYELSQMIVNLKDRVSEETLVSRLPFVTDAHEEVELVKKQREEENQSMMGLGGYNEQ